MGKSRRKTEIAGISCAKSEKKDKRLCNKRLRKKIKQITETKNYDDCLFPLAKEVVNTYSMAKDGKKYYNKEFCEQYGYNYEKIMRK